MRNFVSFVLAVLIFVASAHVSEAALLGTELSLTTIFQSSPTSQPTIIGFLTTATVTEPGVEFPSVKALEAPNALNLTVVDVAINAGDTFIEIGFQNSPPHTTFATGFRNGYLFTFDHVAVPTITGATIDATVTTLGLSPSNLLFENNNLFVNVAGLPFNTSTFARINLSVEGGPPTPIPIPGAIWLFGSGLIGLFGLRRK